MYKKIFSFLIAVLIFISMSLLTNVLVTNSVEADSLNSDCVCAERINWFGACRGDTTRLCKGDLGCGGNCGTQPIDPL